MIALTDAPLRFFVIGPARSGTTLIANFFNSLENGICFGEPMNYAAANPDAWDDQVRSSCCGHLANRVHGDNLQEWLSSALDIDGIDIVGFKEGLWDRAPIRPQMRDWVERSEFTIVVLRDPVKVLSSRRALGWELSGRAEDVLSEYLELEQLSVMRSVSIVTLESFIQAPVASMRGATGLKFEGALELKPTGHKFGDPAANRGGPIRQDTREIIATAEEIDILKPARSFWGRARHGARWTNR